MTRTDTTDAVNEQPPGMYAVRIFFVSAALLCLAAAVASHYTGDGQSARILFIAFVFLIIPGVLTV